MRGVIPLCSILLQMPFFFRSSVSPASLRLAFSLIELLVVVAVIAILAVLGVPAMQGAHKRSLDVRCLANIRQLHLGSMQYALDNNNDTPMAVDNYWHRRVIGYLVPGAGPATFQQGPGTPNYKPGNFACFVCPRHDPRLIFQGVLSYGMNQLLPKKIPALPGRVILLGDVQGQYTLAPHLPGKDNPTERHGNKCDNFIFVDGHAESRTYPHYSNTNNRQLWEP